MLWSFVWLYALARILWTMVVIFVPIFGVLFYWFLAPSPASSRASRQAGGSANPTSDVAGTPWANNPGYTQES